MPHCQNNKANIAGRTLIEYDDVDWCFKSSTKCILQLNNPLTVRKFSLPQHLKYVAHIMRLSNSALQRQILLFFQSNKKLYDLDIWKNYEKLKGLSKMQLQ